MAGLVRLAAGARLMLDGAEWTVEECRPQSGRGVLRGAGGQRRPVTLRALVNDPGFRPVPAGDGLTGRAAGLEDLTDGQREQLHLRVAHMLEAETGFRSGSPLLALAGEPRPEYDPDATTPGRRRAAKAGELRALGPEQLKRLTGVEAVSERTLRRWAGAYGRSGIAGCIDGRTVRASGGRPAITEAVREAIYAVRQETLHRSRLSMRTRDRLIRQYVAERHGPEVVVPSYWTLKRAWADWFGPGGSRPRYARSAAAAPQTGRHVVLHRPGQVVALDTTVLPVKVREAVFGEPASVHLTLALDAYTHSVVAFRLTLVSDTSVDVAMLLRDVMMPLPMREGWGEDMEWPYPGVPAAVVTELAGHKVAGLPFFAPETVTTDHGAVYKSHQLIEVQRLIGANILPARVLRPVDKHAVERAFGAIQSLLFEFLPGYRGVDVADRGADPEADAALTMTEMEHLIATWVVRYWQNRQLGDYAPAWDPGGRHSPNSLFAAAMGQGGFSLQIPPASLYYELLPASFVKVHGKRGVKAGGLWYDGEALDPYRGQPSPRGGRHKGTWEIRRDKRDPRYVFFRDPGGGWHTLRWTGLPPDGEPPPFGDARREQLLRAARQAGLAPKSDAELLPVLLELAGAHVPVDQWPGQLTRQQRVQHAREAAQAAAAAADRPAAAAAAAEPAGAGTDRPGWPRRAQQAGDALDAERRRRREQATRGQRIALPPLLGEQMRRDSLLMLPDDDAAVGEPPAGGTR
jgi:hypothetical protein